jgi:hypothetical protein
MNNPLEIIYHDYSLAVINKSSGILVYRNIHKSCFPVNLSPFLSVRAGASLSVLLQLVSASPGDL